MPTATAAARRAVRHVGRRGAFLLFLTLLDAALGYALVQALPFGLNTAVLYYPFVAVMPLPWWATWWWATGLLAAVAAGWHPARAAAFGAAALLKAAWATGWLVGWLSAMPAFGSGYQQAAIFGAFGGLVLLVSGWRENDR